LVFDLLLSHASFAAGLARGSTVFCSPQYILPMSMIGWKVKDGLFIGNAQSANDLDSAIACKVTRVINCCGGEVPNNWEALGIKYLSYDWEDTGSSVVLDKGDFVANETFDFIEEGLAREEGVLIHSYNAESRSCCVLAAYLMKKYRWSLKKTLEYMNICTLGTEIKMGHRMQLSSYESRVAAECRDVPLARDWNVLDPAAEPGELLISNTYLNLKAQGESAETISSAVHEKSDACVGTGRRPSWSDSVAGGSLAVEQEADEQRRPAPIVQHQGPLKSALKGALKLRCAGAELSESGDDGQPRNASLSIQTRSRVVNCSASELVRKRVGLQYGRSSIILEYEVPTHALRAHHVIKVSFPSGLDDKVVVENLLRDHSPWLDGVSHEQLVGLIGRLRGTRCSVGGS